jgi:serine protease Do
MKKLGLVSVVFLSGAAMTAGYQRAHAPALSLEAAQATPALTVRQASQTSDAFVAISENVTPAVVRIQAEQTVQDRGRRMPSALSEFSTPDDDNHQFPQIAGGSGFVVSPDGYILTNNHVIEGADKITVIMVDKRSFPAHVVGRDLTTDVALLKIDGQNLQYMKLGDSDQAKVGEWVLAIGNPGFGDANTLDFTVTGGIISAKGRPLRIIARELRDARNPAEQFAIEDFIQTDAVINPGNSGGPLVNLRGEVIGINTAIASTTGYSEGYGFAIPANLARRVMKDLVEHGHVRRPLLGISIVDVTKEDAELYHLPRIAGVLVEDFAADSPARRAGLDRNDVIVSIEGNRVESVGQLQRMVAQHDPGDVVDVGVVRFGVQHRFQIRLTQASIPDSGPQPVAKASGGHGVGIEVADLTQQLASKYRFDRTGGAVITRVMPFSAADEKRVAAGFRILSINRRPITTAADARGLLNEAHSGDIISFLLSDATGRTLISNVRVP